MIKDNKIACDWCGSIFRKSTPYVSYTDDKCYHHKCLKSVGGNIDLEGE